MLQRNLEDLERHVQDRQREADCARLELEQCRGDYLNVIRRTLHDYSKRARALAEMASAKLEIELRESNCFATNTHGGTGNAREQVIWLSLIHASY